MFILAISLGVEGKRTPIINFIVEIYEKYSFIKFKINEENIIPKNIEEFYVPTYIPTGFKFIEESNLDTNKDVTTIVWNNDKYGFSIYGKFKEEILFKIAKSIKIIKNF